MSNLKIIIENINNKNFDKALKLCELYENDSNAHIIYNFKGVIYHLLNNLEMAEIYFLKSSKINKKYIDPLTNLFIIYNKIRKIEEMVSVGKKLIEINKIDPSFNYKLGFAFDLNRKFSEALRYYQKCVDLNGKEIKFALNNIGAIYLKKNNPKISLNFFLKAFNLDQNDKIIVNNLLSNYLQLKDKKNSDQFYIKAKNIDKNFVEFKFNEVKYLISNNQIDKAIKILQSNKDHIQFLVQLIKINFTIGNYEEAELLLNDSKEKIKKNSNYFNFLGMRYLFDGDFDNGWKYYEYRPSKHLNILENIKEWNGEDLSTKHIIVYSEQGFGDAIQFSKYIIPLTKISKRVTFVVQRKIKDIFRTDVSNLNIDVEDSIQDKIFDYKITLGSILRYFYTTKLNENENLIKIDKDSCKEWSKKFDTNKINVGIAWSGSKIGPNEPYRSIPIKSLDKLFSLDVNFFCLQNEIWERDLDYFKSSKIVNFGNYNFSELTSIIPNLDLVISSDTSLLHLSASLNKETWGIINLSPDWRWGKFNTINPYASLKLFQQKKFANWDYVVNEIYYKLSKKIKELNI
jgi:tetratricopeptide (TPR) repeat protein